MGVLLEIEYGCLLISKDTGAALSGSRRRLPSQQKKAASYAAWLELFLATECRADYFAGVAGLAVAPLAPLCGTAVRAAGAATPDCTL
jgi:hypothetical protein